MNKYPSNPVRNAFESGYVPDDCEPLMLVFVKSTDLIREIEHYEGVDVGPVWSIGTDGATEIALDDKGVVWSISQRLDCPSRFMNSSCQQLCQCLDVYRQYQSKVRQVSDDAAELEAKDAKAKILSIDRRAVYSTEGAAASPWWSVVLEQMELGTL